jgi:tellurite resistance protein TerC
LQFDLGFIYIIVQVIFLEGILSIDNAAVLGVMVFVLPQKDIIPWHGPFKSLGPPVHRVLGGQVGTVMAAAVMLSILKDMGIIQ